MQQLGLLLYLITQLDFPPLYIVAHYCEVVDIIFIM